ncbi:MAG: peptidase S41, partial [Prevotellaceae bacterium]|nr:peptidase S41 [Prevotellaceae bacterium]
AIAGGVRAQRLHDDVGYLRYATCMSEVTADNIRGAMEHIKQQGDKGEVKGLIIDVRDNGGGALEFAIGFATYFFPEKKVVSYIQYKEGPGHSDFSKLYPQYVKPDGEAVFSGKIVVLTNCMVFSAANDFVATMKCLPNVTLIGNTTGGGGGAPFSGELYNGWRVRISRNPLFDANKQHIEFGIEPDIRVDMDKDDEYEGVDSIIEYAISYLNGSE